MTGIQIVYLVGGCTVSAVLLFAVWLFVMLAALRGLNPEDWE